ncbi:MAG: methyltransferase domain-containing protein, partial [Prolixibacteraceae bacterium]|nr:methyltransferase domain-containing protein [Prolixibacteraceae bacterium]
RVCRLKKITENLCQINIETMELPFEKQSFDMVISNALFHLVHPIDLLFIKISEILKPSGIYAFTYESAKDLSGYKETEPGIWQMITETGVTTFKHKKEYISNLLKENNFRKLKEKTFLAYYNKELDKEFYFSAVLAEKKN